MLDSTDCLGTIVPGEGPMNWKTGVIALLTLGFASSAQAAGAEQGRLAWSAFECSNLAAMSGMQGERQRLFDLGLANGGAFVDSWLAGKISKKEIDDLSMILPVNRPSTDFVLGQVFSAAGESAAAEVEEDAGVGTSLDALVTAAMERFDERNCALLK